MRCLITGVAGFVGTNLALKLLRAGHQVVGTDSLHRKGSEMNLEHLKKQFPDFHFIKTEMEDLPTYIHIIKPDLIYHFAAQVAVTTSVESPRRDFAINAIGSFEVANAARSLGIPVIYTSTNKVFGDNVNKVPIVEHEKRYDFDHPFKEKGLHEEFSIDANKHTPYGISKLVGDLYVREFGGIANRCSCMYGPNQHGIVDQGWLSYFAMNKIQNKPQMIFGDGKQVRDAIHINDVTDLLMLEGKKILNDPQSIAGHAFNVGGGYQNTISLLELCEKWEITPQFGPWRPSDQKVFYCDISKAKQTLKWEPKVSLDQGLQDLYRWVEENYKHA